MKMRTPRAIRVFLTVAGLVCAPAWSSFAQPTDASDKPTDTIFNEIRLDDNGVVAVDTAGYNWYYDFERELFVLGIPEPDETAPDERLIDDGDVSIEQRCTEEIWIKPFETRPVTIGYDEFVDDDVTVLGRVTVKGWVTGDVESLNRRVLVTETGRVDGDIQAPKVVVREGGIVGGDIVEKASPLDIDLRAPFSVAGIVVVASFTAFLLISGVLMVIVAPRYVGNFCVCFESCKVKTFFLGLLLWLLLPPLIVLVAVTIVGIPLTPLVPLAYFLTAVMGMVAFGNMVGRSFARRFLGGEKSRLFQTTVGILLVMSLWFVSAILLGSSGATAEGFGVFFLVIAILLTAFPVSSGVGAAFLTRFGVRKYLDWKDRAKSAAEPPPPAPPPIRPEQFPTSPPDSVSGVDET